MLKLLSSYNEPENCYVNQQKKNTFSKCNRKSIVVENHLFKWYTVLAAFCIAAKFHLRGMSKAENWEEKNGKMWVHEENYQSF